MSERYINQLPLTCPQPGTWSSTQARALTGSRTGNLLVCRPALSPLRHTRQGSLPNFYPPHVGDESDCSTSVPLLPVWMDVVSLIPWLSDSHSARSLTAQSGGGSVF